MNIAYVLKIQTQAVRVNGVDMALTVSFVGDVPVGYEQVSIVTPLTGNETADERYNIYTSAIAEHAEGTRLFSINVVDYTTIELG